MKVITDIVFRASRGSYDWNKFFDGNANLLERGIDYTCADITMMTQARTVGKKMGYKIAVYKHEEGVIVKATKLDTTEDSSSEMSQADQAIVEQQNQEVATKQAEEFSLADEKAVEEANKTVDHTQHLPKKGKNKKK